MDKMNLSRRTFFEAFVENIFALKYNKLKKSRQSICEEIDSQIDKIYSSQKDGYWPVTNGDQVFILYMTLLKGLIDSDKKAFFSYMTRLKNVLFLSASADCFHKLILSAKEHAESKIKVVFLAQETVLWPSFQSVYEACVQDNRYTVSLVYVPFNHINRDKSVDYYEIYKEEMGLPILKHDEYSLSEDSPDVAFFIKPYDLIPNQYYINDVEKVVSRCVYIPYAFFDIPTAISIQYGYGLPIHEKAWKFVAYSQHHLDYIKQYGLCDGRNAVILGHPRFDISSGLNAYPKDEITKSYIAKIKYRRTLLWNTHHSVLDDPESIGVFLQYKGIVFDYFKNHKDVVLLWRPHPLLLGALVNNHLMSQTEVDEMMKLWSMQDNVIIDVSKDYINAFALSDGMLTDAGSSMAFEYVATVNPIYYTVKQNGYIMPKDSIAECWYWINMEDELEKNLNMFLNGEDSMKQERIRKSSKYIGLVDGHCGERICKYTAEEIVKEEKERAIFNFY